MGRPFSVAAVLVDFGDLIGNAADSVDKAVGAQSLDRVVVGGVASEPPSFALTRFLP